MPFIKITLDSASINQAIEELKAYRDKVKDAPKTVVKTLSERGAQQARDLVSYMNAVDTGELMNSIESSVEGDKGYVRATAGHAAYVEFGTGVVGETSPHPNPVGWAYDVNGHGDEGWLYPGDDGKYHWTKGMPSRPYMYDTAQMMAEAVPQVVEEVLQS